MDDGWYVVTKDLDRSSTIITITKAEIKALNKHIAYMDKDKKLRGVFMWHLNKNISLVIRDKLTDGDNDAGNDTKKRNKPRRTERKLRKL